MTQAGHQPYIISNQTSYTIAMLMKTSRCAANNGTSAEEWLFRNNTLLALVAQLSEFWYNFARMKMYASETVINDGTSREIMKGACPPERWLSSVKRSRLQSQEAPRLRSCWLIKPPYCSFHCQTSCVKASLPISCLLLPCPSNIFSTTI